MFKLYYFINANSPALVYTNGDLQPCLQFMKSKNYQPAQCVIISPNNRKITFENNKFVVSGVRY